MQLNSQDIKIVEVITNPGAKYDASVKSVIRIRTKPSQGEGFGGTLRAQNGFRHYFSSMEQANLKYRKGGLEVFTNLNYYGGKFYSYGITVFLGYSKPRGEAGTCEKVVKLANRVYPWRRSPASAESSKLLMDFNCKLLLQRRPETSATCKVFN